MHKTKNLKIKTFEFLLVILTFAFCLLVVRRVEGLPLSVSNANASMQSEKYMVGESEIDIQPFFRPTPTPKQPAEREKPLASGKNFTVTTNAAGGFEFSLSTNILNFGELTATNPVIRSLNLTLICPSEYQIFAGENQPLTEGKIPLPDTTCDSGTCTEITAASWTNTLTYGFGYHTSKMAEKEFKQFADFSKNEPLELISSGQKELQQEILYKVNISGTQQPGAYSNIVTYLAVPSF